MHDYAVVPPQCPMGQRAPGPAPRQLETTPVASLRGRLPALVGLAAMVLLLSGCTGAGASRVRETVARFYAAVQAHDGASACALLAPATRSQVAQSSGKSCSSGLFTQKLPRPGSVLKTSVYGDQAQVRMSGDTAFVAEFRGGWKVVAIGCTARPSQPYNCLVEAG
jgi:hypothetical protein